VGNIAMEDTEVDCNWFVLKLRGNAREARPDMWLERMFNVAAGNVGMK
jgi:hypothetical protein